MEDFLGLPSALSVLGPVLLLAPVSGPQTVGAPRAFGVRLNDVTVIGLPVEFFSWTVASFVSAIISLMVAEATF